MRALYLVLAVIGALSEAAVFRIIIGEAISAVNFTKRPIVYAYLEEKEQA